MLMSKVFANSPKGVLEAIENGEDPSMDDNYPIRAASEYGHIEIVKLLLKDDRVDPTAWDNYSIKAASHMGHINIVKVLVTHEKVDLDEIISKIDIHPHTERYGEIREGLLQAKSELRDEVIDSIL